jgi:hypothetical protein
VELTDGGRISVPSTAGGTVQAMASCLYEWLCIYNGTNYSGYTLQYYKCEFINLGNVSYPAGGRWNDHLRSYINNQTPATRAEFSNWNWRDRFDLVQASYAYDANPSLVQNNDIADGVQVC